MAWHHSECVLAGQAAELGIFVDGELLSPGRDVAGLFPGRQDAADGVERRPAHLGQILARQGKLDSCVTFRILGGICVSQA